jgi:threonine synthase
MTHVLTSRNQTTTWVTLATAHPAKFSSSVEQALSTFPEFNFRESVLPSELKELESLDKRIYRVKGEQGVRDLIERVKRGEDYEPSKEGVGSL